MDGNGRVGRKGVSDYRLPDSKNEFAKKLTPLEVLNILVKCVKNIQQGVWDEH